MSLFFFLLAIAHIPFILRIVKITFSMSHTYERFHLHFRNLTILFQY